MKVCYFGIYDERHPRNATWIRDLRAEGIEVVEICERGKGVAKYIRAMRRLRAIRKEIDSVIVGFPGQQAAILARLAYPGPIAFNALLSLYDAMILDRRVYPRFHWRAAYYWILDYLSFHAVDAVVMDCDAYVDFIHDRFSVKKEACARVFLGSNEATIHPMDIAEDAYAIHYYSSFIPSHGTDVIVRAAKLLEPDGIRFIMSGGGQCLARDKELAKSLGATNISFVERMGSPDELNAFINSSWACLGIFSTIDKAQRAISSKVFEALRCGRPVVTEYNRASAELLKDGESALMCAPGDHEGLARQIRRLKEDEALRQRIAKGGQDAYVSRASASVRATELREILSKIVRKPK